MQTAGAIRLKAFATAGGTATVAFNRLTVTAALP
jgi:hypothetical protein